MAPSGNYLSLFSGVAGLDLAVALAFRNVRCVGYCERESTACEVLAARMEEGAIDTAPIFTDVTTFPSRIYRGHVAGIVAGWPCPPVSVAGRREGTADARWLWPEVVRIIRDTDAQWFLGENVAGILSANDGRALGDVLRDLAQIDFDAEIMCLRASDVGASHSRLRVFILAHRPGARRSGRTGLGQLSDRPALQTARPGDDYRILADATGGRFGVGRESSGSNGLAHGSDEKLADAARDERHRLHGETGAGRGVRETGGKLADSAVERRQSIGAFESTSLDTGQREPDRCTAELADADCGQREERGLHLPERNGSQREIPVARWSSEDLADAKDIGRHSGRERTERDARQGRQQSPGRGEPVADTGNGLLPLPWRQPEGRDGTGPAVKTLDDTDDERWWCIDRTASPDGLGEHRSADAALGHPDVAGLQGRRERGHGADERTTGPAGDPVVADADTLAAGREPGIVRSSAATRETEGSEWERDGRAPGHGSESLDDAMRRRRHDNGHVAAVESRDGQDDGVPESAGAELPLFAPGPGATELWQDVLVRAPWLRPAWSQTETQSILRGIFDGDTSRLDIEDRTDRLRSIGNMVCPLQAGVAFVVLARRAGLIE